MAGGAGTRDVRRSRARRTGVRWLVAMIAAPLLAHDPATTRLTYTRDISRLINRRCIACHGANAAVPLASYEQSRPWAKAIRDQVMTRRMPPWGAVAGFGPYLQGDPQPHCGEIATVVRWVEGGAPERQRRLAADKQTLFGTAGTVTHSLTVDAARLRVEGAARLSPNGVAIEVGIADDADASGWRDAAGDLAARVAHKAPGFRVRGAAAHPARFTLRVASDEELDAALALSPVGASPLLPGTENRKQTPRCPVP